jgi:hypothetical protein
MEAGEIYMYNVTCSHAWWQAYSVSAWVRQMEARGIADLEYQSHGNVKWKCAFHLTHIIMEAREIYSGRNILDLHDDDG